MVRSVLPAIVIAAYDRPDELRQLIASVCAADIAAGTPLIISVDGGGSNHSQVQQVAQATAWHRGDFRIIVREHLGLVDHFHICGELTSEYGSIVFLEDDLVVGPAFHRWATVALNHAKTDARVAGVSLAAPFFDGYRHLPFEPVIDGFDNLYAQIPWYDGMAWTAEMWQRFRSHSVDPTTPIHRLFHDLSSDEWFPDAVRYLVETDRYYLLPRNSHATNSGAAGTHFSERTNYFQVPLTLRGPAEWRLAELDQSLAVYDDHMELSARVVSQLVPSLKRHDVVAADLVVDLLGTRDLRAAVGTHVLTTRQTTSSIRSWGASLHPLITNLIHDIHGDDIHLAARNDVVSSPASDAVANAALRRHANRGQDGTARDALGQLANSLKKRLARGQ